MRLASSPGRWSDAGIPRGTRSRCARRAVTGTAVAVSMAIAVVSCGDDETSSVEPRAGDLAENPGIDVGDVVGFLWSAVAIVAEAVITILAVVIWEVLKFLSPLLALVAFGWTAIAIMRRASRYERLNALPRAVGLGALASIVPLCIWIFA